MIENESNDLCIHGVSGSCGVAEGGCGEGDGAMVGVASVYGHALHTQLDPHVGRCVQLGLQ